MDNITIREMNLNDLDIIKNIGFKNFDEFWNINILYSELEKSDSNSIYFVALYNNEIIGFIGGLCIIDQIDIMNIAVKKDKRGIGIGSALLSYFINYFKNKNIFTITLEVNQNNISAINLYKKYNFKQIGLRKKYYNNTDDAIIMSLNL